VAVLEAAATATGCETFGLRMAESRRLSSFGPLSLLISLQPTVRAALLTTIQYRDLVNESVALMLEDVGETSIIRQEVMTNIAARQATELAIGVVFRLCRGGLGPNWRPTSVNFAHPAPTDTTIHWRIFGCPLAFGSELNGIVCRSSDLDVPNPHADPAMARYAQRFVDMLPRLRGRNVSHDVRCAVTLMLPMGKATSVAVAEALGLSVRRMQGKLDEAGETFTGILNDVRGDLAKRYVDNTDYSMLHVAQLLGYTSASAFSRWFSGEFAMPPIEWRARSKVQTPAPDRLTPPSV
jgi:AraC-like DNA-binding protein